MLVWDLREGRQLELRIGDRLLGSIGLTAGRRGRATLAIELPPTIRVSPAARMIGTEPVRPGQFTKTVSPAA